MNLAVDPSLPARPIGRVAPTVLAHEQTMPVADDLAELFAERALVRGRTMACTGPAATSAAMALVAAAVAAGSWLAVVDVRIRARCGQRSGHPAGTGGGHHHRNRPRYDQHGRSGGAEWVEVMAAAVDGFDLVFSRQPSQCRTPG